MVRNEKKEIGPNWVLVGMQFIIFSILLAVSIMIISNLPSFLKQNPLHRRRLALDPSLLEESKEIWAFEPGEFHRLQMKSFTYYNITNPYNVVRYGLQHLGDLEEVKEVDFKLSGYMENLEFERQQEYINFQNTFSYSKATRNVNSDDNIRTINMLSLRKWEKIKKKEIWKIAGQSFFALCRELSTNILHVELAEQFRIYFREEEHRTQLTINSNLSEKELENLWHGDEYGLLVGRNTERYIYGCEHLFSEDNLYFIDWYISLGLKLTTAQLLKRRICSYVIGAKEQFYTYLQVHYNITYDQLLFAQWRENLLWKEKGTFAEVYGHFYSGYLSFEEYFEYAKSIMKQRFIPIYNNITAELKENPNIIYYNFDLNETKSTSLFGNNNFEALFACGELSPSPFTSTEEILDLSKMGSIASSLGISLELAHILYYYMDTFTKVTVLKSGELTPQSGQSQQISAYLSQSLATSMRNTAQFLYVTLISRYSCHTFDLNTCRNVFGEFFAQLKLSDPSLYENLLKAICDKEFNFLYFNIGKENCEGWSLWIEAFLIAPVELEKARIFDYLHEFMTDFEIKWLSPLMDEEQSLTKFLSKTLLGIKEHYVNICGREGMSESRGCTFSVIFWAQWAESLISLNPPPECKLEPVVKITGWKDIILQLSKSRYGLEAEMPPLYYEKNKDSLMTLELHLKINSQLLHRIFIQNKSCGAAEFSSLMEPGFLNYIRFAFKEIIIGPFISEYTDRYPFIRQELSTNSYLDFLRTDMLYGGDCTLEEIVFHQNPSYSQISHVSGTIYQSLEAKHKISTGVYNPSKLNKFKEYYGYSIYQYPDKFMSPKGSCMVTDVNPFPERFRVEQYGFKQVKDGLHNSETPSIIDEDWMRPITIGYVHEVNYEGVLKAYKYKGLLYDYLQFNSWSQYYHNVTFMYKVHAIYHKPNVHIQDLNIPNTYFPEIENKSIREGIEENEMSYILDGDTGYMLSSSSNDVLSFLIESDVLFNGMREQKTIIFPLFYLTRKFHVPKSIIIDKFLIQEPLDYQTGKIYAIVGIITTFATLGIGIYMGETIRLGLKRASKRRIKIKVKLKGKGRRRRPGESNRDYQRRKRKTIKFSQLERWLDEEK